MIIESLNLKITQHALKLVKVSVFKMVKQDMIQKTTSVHAGLFYFNFLVFPQSTKSRCGPQSTGYFAWF